jgi:addiction module HigA family antidote
MTRVFNPPHPGEVLRDTILRPDGGMTVTAFAKRLGLSRVALSRVVNVRAAVSAELAFRLAAALGGPAESWLTMQAAYDLWQAGKKRRPKIKLLAADSPLAAEGLRGRMPADHLGQLQGYLRRPGRLS